jgi:predicted RND superfamily exporter protein
LYTALVSLGGATTVLIASSVLDVPLSVIAAILPVLVLFYGTSSSLHIFFHGGDFRRVLVPCLLTAVTTCAGFAVFIFDPIPLLRDFALLAIVGIAGVFVWSLVVFYPRTYALEPARRLVQFFDRFPARRGGLILAAGLVAVGITVPGLLRVQTDIHSLSVLSPENRRVRDHHFVEDNVGNYLPLEYRVDADRLSEGQLYGWMGEVLDLEEVTGALSYLDFSDPERPVDFGYVTADGREGRVTFLIPLLSTREGLALVERIGDLAESAADGYRPRVTGYVTLYAQIADELHRSFIRSLVLAFALVYLVMLAYLRSPRLFLASVVPNAIPVLLVISIMGWFGIRLDMATMPMGCLLLGIIVDDSIHFLYWYKRFGDLTETFRRAGPGILYTSTALICGFAVYLVSTSPPTRNFGLLGIAALSTGLASVLMLLPAVLERIVAKHEVETP